MEAVFESPVHEQLHWAERHANDLSIAEHNRKHFQREAERLRDILATKDAS